MIYCRQKLRAQRGILLAILLLILIVSISCEKYPEVESIIGTYSCTVISVYQCDTNPGNLQCTDTVGVDKLVEIVAVEDNTIKVILGENSFFSATYDGVSRFENYGGSYAKLFDGDNIYIRDKHGVLSYYSYYGKRN